MYRLLTKIDGWLYDPRIDAKVEKIVCNMLRNKTKKMAHKRK